MISPHIHFSVYVLWGKDFTADKKKKKVPLLSSFKERKSYKHNSILQFHYYKLEL